MREQQTWLLVDGLSCSACMLGLEKSLQDRSASAAISFLPGTHILRCEAATVERFDEVHARIKKLGYDAYPLDRAAAFADAAAKRRAATARSLAIMGFTAAWIGMLAWVVYISKNALAFHQEHVINIIMFLTFLPIAFISVPVLLKSSFRSLKMGRPHIDWIILIGLVSSLTLALLTLTGRKPQAMFLDSTSMSLFLVFAARYLGQEARASSTNATLNGTLDPRLVPGAFLDAYCDRLMGALFGLSLVTTIVLAGLMAENLNWDTLFSVALIWPLAACPCLLSACSELMKSWGIRARVASRLLALDAFMIAVFNVSAVTKTLNRELTPESLSLLMLGLVLALVLSKGGLALVWESFSPTLDGGADPETDKKITQQPTDAESIL